MGILDWFQGLNPQAQAALLGGGMNVLGGLTSGMGLEGQQEDSQAHQLEIARMNNLAGLYGADNSRYIAAQNAIGSPLAIQRERAGMSMLGDMLGNAGASSTQQVFAPPHIAPFQGRVGGGAGDGTGKPSQAAQFLTPDAMANAEVPFWQNLSALNPDINPNLRAAGYGSTPGSEYASGMIDQSRLGNATKQAQERAAIMGALGGGGGMGAPGGGAPPKGYEYDKKTGQLKKKGGGFWKTLGKIGLGIGGGIATAMTGGAAAPLVAAGFGALSGGIDGGWKGALTGGALGGLTAGLGGAAGAARQGFGQAVKSTLLNPQSLTNIAGQGIGGNVGTALQLGSMAMPGSFHGYNKDINGLPKVNKLPDDIQARIEGTVGVPTSLPGPAGIQDVINNPWQGMTQKLMPNAPGAPQTMQDFLRLILGGQGGAAPQQQGFGVPGLPKPANIVDPRTPQQRQAEMIQMLMPLIMALAGQKGSQGRVPIRLPQPPVMMNFGAQAPAGPVASPYDSFVRSIGGTR